MDIAYSICNIGFGHSTRSLNILRELEARGHNITVMIGRPYDTFFKQKGFQTYTISNSIDLTSEVGVTLLKSLHFIRKTSPTIAKSFLKTKKVLDKTAPDILVSDSEIVSLLVKRNIPRILISHQMTLFVELVKAGLARLWHKYINRYCDQMLVPDVLNIPIPQRISEKVQKIGPLYEPIEPTEQYLKKKLGIKDNTTLFMPSFATKNKKTIISKLHQVSQETGWNFVLLGQPENKKEERLTFLKKEDVDSSCSYIKACNAVILSGYTSLMESVYYQKPTLIIPTQIEQKELSKRAEHIGIAKRTNFKNIQEWKEFLENKTEHKKMKEAQKTFHTNGAKEAADIIED